MQTTRRQKATNLLEALHHSLLLDCRIWRTTYFAEWNAEPRETNPLNVTGGSAYAGETVCFRTPSGYGKHLEPSFESKVSMDCKNFLLKREADFNLKFKIIWNCLRSKILFPHASRWRGVKNCKFWISNVTMIHYRVVKFTEWILSKAPLVKVPPKASFVV